MDEIHEVWNAHYKSGPSLASSGEEDPGDVFAHALGFVEAKSSSATEAPELEFSSRGKGKEKEKEEEEPRAPAARRRDRKKQAKRVGDQVRGPGLEGISQAAGRTRDGFRLGEFQQGVEALGEATGALGAVGGFVQAGEGLASGVEVASKAQKEGGLGHRDQRRGLQALRDLLQGGSSAAASVVGLVSAGASEMVPAAAFVRAGFEGRVGGKAGLRLHSLHKLKDRMVRLHEWHPVKRLEQDHWIYSRLPDTPEEYTEFAQIVRTGLVQYAKRQAKALAEHQSVKTGAQFTVGVGGALAPAYGAGVPVMAVGGAMLAGDYLVKGKHKVEKEYAASKEHHKKEKSSSATRQAIRDVLPGGLSSRKIKERFREDVAEQSTPKRRHRPGGESSSFAAERPLEFARQGSEDSSVPEGVEVEEVRDYRIRTPERREGKDEEPEGTDGPGSDNEDHLPELLRKVLTDPSSQIVARDTWAEYLTHEVVEASREWRSERLMRELPKLYLEEVLQAWFGPDRGLQLSSLDISEREDALFTTMFPIYAVEALFSRSKKGREENYARRLFESERPDAYKYKFMGDPQWSARHVTENSDDPEFVEARLDLFSEFKRKLRST